MKHAREDYNRIQDPAGLIPDDEPVFLLRAQDELACRAVAYYAGLCANVQAPEISARALAHSKAMAEWPKKKVPDLPDDLATHPQAPASPLPEAEAQKAVAPFGWYGESRFDNDFTTNEDTSRRWHTNGYRLTPLYATPSAGAPLPEQRQEAVAWQVCSAFTGGAMFPARDQLAAAEADAATVKTPTTIRALYAAPTPQAVKVPLTEEQLKKLDFYAHRDTGCKTGSWAHLMTFARAIEAAHGIHPTEGERK